MKRLDTDAGTPKVDALEALLAVFSAEQLMVIAQSAALVSGGSGYGAVEIRFVKGVPRFIGRKMQDMMPKPMDVDDVEATP